MKCAVATFIMFAFFTSLIFIIRQSPMPHDGSFETRVSRNVVPWFRSLTPSCQRIRLFAWWPQVFLKHVRWYSRVTAQMGTAQITNIVVACECVLPAGPGRSLLRIHVLRGTEVLQIPVTVHGRRCCVVLYIVPKISWCLLGPRSPSSGESVRE